MSARGLAILLQSTVSSQREVAVAKFANTWHDEAVRAQACIDLRHKDACCGEAAAHRVHALRRRNEREQVDLRFRHSMVLHVAAWQDE